MFLSEVTDRLYRSGMKQDQVELIRIDLFEKYPEIEEEIFSTSLSTAPPDPEVPDDWVKFIFDRTFGSSRRGEGSFYLNNPDGLINESDKEALIGQVKELFPDPSVISDKKERLKVEKDIARAESAIRGAENVGLTISESNTKLGKMSNFSLPAGNNFRVGACPGATELCEKLCYAKGALFKMNEWRYYVNWAYAQLWPDKFVEAWRKANISKVVRVHAGGDFYSTDYINMWVKIAKACHDIRFYAYTRSWQDGKGSLQRDFIEALDELSKVENFRLILSVDRETGMPPKEVVPAAFRAWLATSDADVPPSGTGLVFRDKGGMEGVAQMMGGAPVCPVERSADYTKASGKLTCQNCAFCWSTGHEIYGLRDDDPSAFDRYAKVDINARTALMFRGVGTSTPAPVANPRRSFASVTRGNPSKKAFHSGPTARRGTPAFEDLMEEMLEEWDLEEDLADDIVELRRYEDTFEYRLKGHAEWELLEDDGDDEDDVDDDSQEEE